MYIIILFIESSYFFILVYFDNFILKFSYIFFHLVSPKVSGTCISPMKDWPISPLGEKTSQIEEIKIETNK